MKVGKVVIFQDQSEQATLNTIPGKFEQFSKICSLVLGRLLACLQGHVTLSIIQQCLKYKQASNPSGYKLIALCFSNKTNYMYLQTELNPILRYQWDTSSCRNSPFGFRQKSVHAWCIWMELWLKIFRNDTYSPNFQIVNGAFAMFFGSRATYLAIFRHIIPLIFDPQNQKYYTLLQQVF